MGRIMLTPKIASEKCEAAAERVAASLSTQTFDIPMPGIKIEDVRGTNSLDRSFIDRLIKRKHLR